MDRSLDRRVETFLMIFFYCDDHSIWNTHTNTCPWIAKHHQRSYSQQKWPLTWATDHSFTFGLTPNRSTFVALDGRRSTAGWCAVWMGADRGHSALTRQPNSNRLRNRLHFIKKITVIYLYNFSIQNSNICTQHNTLAYYPRTESPFSPHFHVLISEK